MPIVIGRTARVEYNYVQKTKNGTVTLIYDSEDGEIVRTFNFGQKNFAKAVSMINTLSTMLNGKKIPEQERQSENFSLGGDA